MKLHIIILILILIPVELVLGAIILNDLPLTDTPGIKARLITYMTSNITETSASSIYPELVTREYTHNANELNALIEETCRDLDWHVQHVNGEKFILHAIATTPLWRFKDDVIIKSYPVDERKQAVFLRSISRSGKADLGTNTRHILDFYNRLEQKL